MSSARRDQTKDLYVLISHSEASHIHIKLNELPRNFDYKNQNILTEGDLNLTMFQYSSNMYLPYHQLYS